MIAWTFLSAFAGAVIALALPKRMQWVGKWIALVAAAAGLAAVLALLAAFDRSPGAEEFQFQIVLPWVPGFGAGIHLGADGISLAMLLLTGVVAVAGVLFSWNVTREAGRFFGLYLLVIAGAYGVFVSLDVFLLLVFYEIVILPKYLLIAGWGSTRKEYGAMKLTMYSIGGSALVLAGVLAVHVVSGTGSFDLLVLGRTEYPPEFQMWAFPVLFLGFGVLAGLWPFHTWAPTGHVAAPTAASMLLAGVVMKLGAYGALRVAMTLLPDGARQWGVVFAVLGAVGIVYGACVAFTQRDLKFVIGYSSVSHMGFVILGLATMSSLGMTGGVLQMFSHGIIAGLLFAIVGRIVYDRAHTRDLSELGRMRLGRTLPFAAGAFTVASIASMGMPGFSGFVAELTILIGVWEVMPKLLLVVVPGIVVVAAFSLRALTDTFFAGESSGLQSQEVTPLPELERITWPEVAGFFLLLAASIWLGLAPEYLMDLVRQSFEGELMGALLP